MKRNLLKYGSCPLSPKEILLIQPQIQRNCESFQKPDILEVACQINLLRRGYAAKVYHLSHANSAKIFMNMIMVLHNFGKQKTSKNIKDDKLDIVKVCHSSYIILKIST